MSVAQYFIHELTFSLLKVKITSVIFSSIMGVILAGHSFQSGSAQLVWEMWVGIEVTRITTQESRSNLRSGADAVKIGSLNQDHLD